MPTGIRTRKGLGGRETLIQGAHQAVAARQKERRGDFKAKLVAVMLGAMNPMVGGATLALGSLREFAREYDFEQLKRRARERLIRYPKTLSMLQRDPHIVRDREFKNFLDEVAREANERATVRRRVGIPKNSLNEARNNRLRVLRRLGAVE